MGAMLRRSVPLPLLFRAYHQGAAGTIVEIDAPGLGPADLSQLEYENVPEDIYPLSRR